MGWRVGFVGAGQMGEPMVRRLLAAGVEVSVYARRPEVADRLAAAGAGNSASLTVLAESSDMVICCVFSDDQLADVALGEGGLAANMNPGSVLVSHTTGSETVLHEIASVAEDRNIAVVDAPVSGTVGDIEKAELTILLGGADRAADTVTSTLESYANPVLRTGALGSALKVKLVNNLLFTANLQLLAEAVELGSTLEVEEGALLDAVAHCSGSSSASERARECGGVHAFGEIALPFLRKDVAACAATLREFDSNAGLLEQLVTSGTFNFAPTTATQRRSRTTTPDPWGRGA